MTASKRALIIVGGVLALAGLAWGGWRVVALESEELEYYSEWTRLVPTPAGAAGPQPHRELGRVELEEGEDVTFEVCAQGELDPRRWGEAELEIALWIPATQKIMVRRPFDEEALQSATSGGGQTCLIIAQGAGLTESGEFAVEAIWRGGDLPAELRRVPFRAHILAFDQPQPRERLPVVVILLGALLITLAFALKGRRRSELDDEPALDDEPSPRPSLLQTMPRPALTVLTGVGALIAAGFAVAFIPIGGSLGGLIRAIVLSLVQVTVVLMLVRPALVSGAGRQGTLGLKPPRQGLWVLVLAVVAGLALWLLGHLPMHFIPATSQSAVGAMVAWPSGSLAVALVSVLSPLVEEVFFRGFVYGTLARRFGALAAFLCTICVFSVVHLPQTWGAWGGFAAVTITGIGLTALRLWSGSIVVPAVAHLAHNSAITLLWVITARG